MEDIIFYITLISVFLGSLLLVRRLLRFLYILYFDQRVTVRYTRNDGTVVSKTFIAKEEGDLIKALDELRESPSYEANGLK